LIQLRTNNDLPYTEREIIIKIEWNKGEGNKKSGDYIIFFFFAIS